MRTVDDKVINRNLLKSLSSKLPKNWRMELGISWLYAKVVLHKFRSTFFENPWKFTTRELRGKFKALCNVKVSKFFEMPILSSLEPSKLRKQTVEHINLKEKGSLAPRTTPNDMYCIVGG